MRMAPCNIGNRALSSSHIFLFLLVHLPQNAPWASTQHPCVRRWYTTKSLLVLYYKLNTFGYSYEESKSVVGGAAQRQHQKRHLNVLEMSGNTLNAGLRIAGFRFLLVFAEKDTILKAAKNLQTAKVIKCSGFNMPLAQATSWIVCLLCHAFSAHRCFIKKGGACVKINHALYVVEHRGRAALRSRAFFGGVVG